MVLNHAWKMDEKNELIDLGNPKVILLMMSLYIFFILPLRLSIRASRQNTLSPTDVVPGTVFLTRRHSILGALGMTGDVKFFKEKKNISSCQGKRQ